ncbi:hypothetical protein LP420_06145 [Massilia sp. B-10]|nr:hypothetical protein LP420_06145 [Massilia sp. B-10]
MAPYELVIAAPEAGPLMTTSGVSLNATVSLRDPGLQADTLLIAYGRGRAHGGARRRTDRGIAGHCATACRASRPSARACFH